MWGGGESWGGGWRKRKPEPTRLPFPEVVPGPKSTLPHPPGWPKAQLLLHSKGTEAGQLPPRSEVSDKAASLFTAPHSWGEVSTLRRHSTATDWHSPARPQLLLPWGPISYN